MKFEIEDYHIKDLRAISKKLDGVHDRCSIIITSICDCVEDNPIIEDG